MPELLRDDNGLPVPQHMVENGDGFEETRGREGALFVRTKNGHNETLGSTSDPEASTGNGSVISILKFLRTKLSDLANIFDGSKKIGTVSIDNYNSAFGSGKILGVVDVGNFANFFAADKNIGIVKINNFTDTFGAGKEIGIVEVKNPVAVYRPEAKVGSLSGAISVGTTAVELKVGTTALSNRKAVIVFNNSVDTDIYIGFSNTVTVEDGFPIKPGTKEKFEMLASENLKLYAITSSGNADVRIMELL